MRRVPGRIERTSERVFKRQPVRKEVFRDYHLWQLMQAQGTARDNLTMACQIHCVNQGEVRIYRATDRAPCK